MNANLPLAMAQALAPFAPPKSEVHRILKAAECKQLQELHRLDATERREMRAAVMTHNNYLAATGGLL